MQAIPCDPVARPARLCAPSCEHLFLPSQWWSEPLSNWLWFKRYVSLQIRLAYWGQEMPTKIQFKRPWICMTIIVHVVIYLLSLWNGGKISKQPKHNTLIIILPQHVLKSGHSPKTPGTFCDASIFAHSFTNAWSFSSEETNPETISYAISLSRQPARIQIWLANCGLIWKGTLWRSHVIPYLHEKFFSPLVIGNKIAVEAIWNNLRWTTNSRKNSPKHLTTTAKKWDQMGVCEKSFAWDGWTFINIIYWTKTWNKYASKRPPQRHFFCRQKQKTNLEPSNP